MSTTSFQASASTPLHYFHTKSRPSFTFRALVFDPLIDICKSTFSTLREHPLDTLSLTTSIVLNWTNIKSKSPEIVVLAMCCQTLRNGKTAWELTPKFKKKTFLNTVIKVSFFAAIFYTTVAIPKTDIAEQAFTIYQGHCAGIPRNTAEKYIKCYQAGKNLEECNTLMLPSLDFNIRAFTRHPNNAISLASMKSTSPFVCIYTQLTPDSHVSKKCLPTNDLYNLDLAEVLTDFESPLPPIAQGETFLEFNIYTGLNKHCHLGLPLELKEKGGIEMCMLTHEIALNQTTKVCVATENFMLVREVIEDPKSTKNFVFNDLNGVDKSSLERIYTLFNQIHDEPPIEILSLLPTNGLLINVKLVTSKVSPLMSYIISRKKRAAIKPTKKTDTVIKRVFQLLNPITSESSDISPEEFLNMFSNDDLLEGLKESQQSEKTKPYFHVLSKRHLSDPFIESVVKALLEKEQLSMAVSMTENIDDDFTKTMTAYAIIDTAIKTKKHQASALKALNLFSDEEIKNEQKIRIQTEFTQKNIKQSNPSSSSALEKKETHQIQDGSDDTADISTAASNSLVEYIHQPREAKRRQAPGHHSEINPDYDSITHKLKELDLKFLRTGKGSHEIWGIEGVEVTVTVSKTKALGTTKNILAQANLIKKIYEEQKNQASSSGAK